MDDGKEEDPNPDKDPGLPESGQSGGNEEILFYNKKSSFWIERLFTMLALTGVVSAIFAIVAIGAGDYIGAGTCLTASAVSFGMWLHAFLKD